MYRRQHASPPRQGMILLVVLCLLTLFAIIGISFVLYAESTALSSRLNKDSMSKTPPAVDPSTRIALNTLLNAFMYGSLDPENALRGTDLATDLYGGFGSATSASGLPGPITPFSGTGRLHLTYTSGIHSGIDDFDIINYQYFSADGIRHDPECYDSTGSFYSAPTVSGGTPKAYVGGFNPPYTYPDKNHIYLGAIRPFDGAIIARSFHREYGPFGSLAPTNGNWGSAYTAPVNATNAKYLVLRPHPAYHPTFPLPADFGGDVKNIPQSPGMVNPATGTLVAGCNDSFWIDVDAPVQQAANGTYYKMMIAPFIVDLDGLLNVNATGNVRSNAGGPPPIPPISASNMGFGTWEVDPAMVLDSLDPTNSSYLEYPDLFLQRLTTPLTYGRYGADLRPSSGGTSAPVGLTPHYYGQVDFDGTSGYTTAAGTGSASGGTLTFPTGANLFPTYPAGYENGGVELIDHPLLYNPFFPLSQTTAGLYDQRFATSDLEQLYRWGDTNYQSSGSLLVQQLPYNFNLDANAPRRRRQVTTDSTDFIVAGKFSYIQSPAGSPLAISGSSLAPQGAAINFPALIAANLPPSSPATWTEFGPNWQYNAAYALKRLDLNRTLTAYPTYVLSSRHDDNSVNPLTSAQYLQATSDRQQFADDIYRTLLVVTGVVPPAVATAPTDAELAPMRWLAQLAVNIVDFIDEDNINTVYNFYGTKDGLLGANLGDNVGTPSGGATYPLNPDVPRYWVTGTEQPRLLLTEALAEAFDSNATHNIPVGANPPANVKVWVELLNPLNGPPTTLRPEDAAAVPLQVAAVTASAQGVAFNALYAPYRIVVNTPSGPTPSNPDGFAQAPSPAANVFGASDVAPNAPLVSTQDSDFTTTATNPLTLYPSTTQPAGTIPMVGTAAAGSTPYFLLGPATDTGTTSGTQATTWMCDPLAAGSLVPSSPVPTPFLRIGTANSATNSGLSFFPTTWGTANTTDQRTAGLTVLLRRLADPQLPNNPNPTTTDGMGNIIPNPWYNPYVTIDYLDQVPVRDPVQDTTTQYASRGRVQAFVAKTVLSTTGTPTIRTLDLVNSQVQDQTTQDPGVKPSAGAPPSATYHTFGLASAPLAPNFTWLVHLDRQVTSPMELLHVSGYPQYQLTQQFITGAATANQFNQLAPWLDQDLAATPTQSHRLYRLFEFLDAGTRPTWTGIGTRTPGRVNLNTMWETPGQRTGPPTTYNEVFRALCDSNPNNFYNRDGTNTYSGTTPYNTVPDAVLLNLLATRSPNNGIPGDPNAVSPTTPDRPFLSLAIGLDTAGTDVQYPNGHSLNDTILRPLPSSTATPINGPQLLLEDPNVTGTTHPYQRYQLLTKIFNNVTNRSNCFAIWVTAGYFTVPGTPPFATPPVLGPEVGISTSTNVRHRAFAIVDRTKMQLFSTTTSAAVTVTAPNAYSPATYTAPDLSAVLTAISGTSTQSGATWSLGTGQVLVFEPGTANEEAVVVTGTGPFSAVFMKSHPMYATVIIRGNPGPWIAYDYRQDPSVLYTNLIY
jgi:hypothetical protein